MNNSRHLGMDRSATYFIRVEGCIGERWKDWFSDLRITLNDNEAFVTSVLEGTITDQAALLGLLQKLYSLGLPLLEVRCVEPG